MQILEIHAQPITLHHANSVILRTKKITENIRLKNTIISFDLRYTVPAGRKVVFMNKLGCIDEINIFQDGKRIL